MDLKETTCFSSCLLLVSCSWCRRTKAKISVLKHPERKIIGFGYSSRPKPILTPVINNWYFVSLVCQLWLVICYSLPMHLSAVICPASLSLSLFIGLITYIHARQLYGVHYFTLDQWLWKTSAIHSKDCKRAQHYNLLSGDKLSFEVEMSNKNIYKTHRRASNPSASVTECQWYILTSTS